MEYELFFDYLSRILKHSKKLVQIAVDNGGYIGKYFSYPQITYSENFPSFSQTFFSDGPIDYKNLFSNSNKKINLYDMQEVNNFFDEISKDKLFFEKYLNERLQEIFKDNTGKLLAFEHTLIGMIDRLLQINGFSDISLDLLQSIIKPIYNSIYCLDYEYDVYYPILFVKFDFDIIKEDNYSIAKMDEGTQLARCHCLGYKLGAILALESCATHALVIHNNKTKNSRVNHLFDRSEYDGKEYIAENFFAALKIMANIDSGYSQILFMPKDYATSYYSDLPFIESRDSNEYPSYFRNYFWNSKEFPKLDIERASSVIALMKKIIGNSERKIKIAINRLQNCQKRTSSDDIILDSIIGIETLLSDGDKGELTYKLSMRTAVILANYGSYKISRYEIYKCMKKIYDYRSAIVHGKDQKEIDRAKYIIIGEIKYSTLSTSIEFLRDLIAIIIDNAKYLDSTLIDELILT